MLFLLACEKPLGVFATAEHHGHGFRENPLQVRVADLGSTVPGHLAVADVFRVTNLAYDKKSPTLAKRSMV
jgi:hypothetical protein